MKLTPAQERYLADIVAAGEKKYNDRARRPLAALESAGLITVDWDLIPAAIGKWYWINTATPTQAGIDHVRRTS